MWVIDIRHWLNEQQDGPAAPQLRRKVEKLAEIISWITSRDRGLDVGEPPKCRRRPKKKPCTGRLQLQYDLNDRIYWYCPECGDEGLLDGWQWLIWDMSDDDFRFLSGEETIH